VDIPGMPCSSQSPLVGLDVSKLALHRVYEFTTCARPAG
jgi:hypothetical protein